MSVDAMLDTFLSRADRGPFAYAECHHFPGLAEGSHVVVGFAIHGNEHGSLPALLRLQEHLQNHAPSGPVTLLLGNVEAVRADVRFLDEDFNRVFSFDRPAESRERRRAELARAVLDRADVFLDLHQTQTPTTEAFYTQPWSPELAAFARAVEAAPVGLTRAPGEAFSPGLRCLDEYVRDRGKVGFTVELGLRGQDAAQATRAEGAVLRLLEVVRRVDGGEELASVAAERPAIRWFETTHVERSTPDSRLRPGLQNWLAVRQGEILSDEGAPLITCPADGVVLFPKYPPAGQLPPPELLRIARPLDDPASHYSRF